MQAFTLTHPASLDAALSAAAEDGAKYIAGGTDLMQLAKDNVETPTQLVDLDGLLDQPDHRRADGSLRLGALARMVDVAAHPDVRAAGRRCREALLPPPRRRCATWAPSAATCCSAPAAATSATPASPATSACPAPAARRSRREPRPGVLGVSDHCIATNPSDMPVALVALDASVELQRRAVAAGRAPGEFYRLPGDTPHIETDADPGELITAIVVPASRPRASPAT